MLESLQSITSRSREFVWGVGDTRVFVEGWFRQQTGSDKVYCTDVGGGVAVLRVGTPVLFQEVWIRQADLFTALEAASHGKASVRTLKVVSEYI